MHYYGILTLLRTFKDSCLLFAQRKPCGKLRVSFHIEKGNSYLEMLTVITFSEIKSDGSCSPIHGRSSVYKVRLFSTSSLRTNGRPLFSAITFIYICLKDIRLDEIGVRFEEIKCSN